MNWEIIFIFVIFAVAIFNFVTERISSDLTAISLYTAILLGGLLPFAQNLPTPDEMLTVFANPAPITIGAMFIVSAALQKCGAIAALSQILGKLTGLGYRNSSLS